MTTPAVQPEDLSQLAARCARGDRGAQRELFLRTRAVVHRTLYRILGSNRDVEDLLQETFLIMFRSIDRFEGRSSVSTWCCGIAVNVAYNHLRAARRRQHEPEVDVVDPVADPGRQLAEHDAVQRLYQALAAIDPEQRVAFTLSVIDGQSVAAVAALLGVSSGAVKTRVWRARKHLERLARKDPALASYVSALAEDLS